MLPLRVLLLSLPVALAAMPLAARTMDARIDRVVTAAATMQRVVVRLDWPAGADHGELAIDAGRIEAPDLGYRYDRVRWRCPLQRDDGGGWHCDGEVRGAGKRPLRLSVDLGAATTDVALRRGKARLALHRADATPDLSTFDLTRVPAAWAQALLSQAWPSARLQQGALDGRLRLHAGDAAPLRVEGRLAFSGIGLDTPDGSIAAEGLGGELDIDYRKLQQVTLVAVDGALRGGQLLAGNAYVALPATPVALRIDARSDGTGGWLLPHVEWRDGDVLVATGSAGFAPDASLRDLDMQLHGGDIAPMRDRYLSGWLGLVGLGGLRMSGAFDAAVRVADGRLRSASATLDGVDLADPGGRFRFDGLSGDPRFSAGAPVAGALRWTGGQLYGLDFGAATLPLTSRDGELRIDRPVTVPALGGSLRFDDVVLVPPAAGAGADMRFGLALRGLDLAKLSQALGWPAFRGTLSGEIPRAHYAGERLDFDGGLAMHAFDGSIAVSSLSMERPFGVAPTLSADIALDGLDLAGLTEVFGFGSISGRLDGRIDGLRLVDWQAQAFDAELHTVRTPGVRQRISQRAVQDLSSVGDASLMSGLQARLIGLFDDFGYARIGISCRLANETCEMDGLRSAGRGFIIVEGSGIPRLTVVGYNHHVDWPTLVERLSAVGKGDVKPVVQ